jgi:hypothetical protein
VLVARYTGLKPVKRWSLRAAYVGATLATALATLLPEPAHAHLDVRPGIVQAGTAVELLVELPRLRPGRRPVGLELEADGLEVLSTRLVDAVRTETLWAARVRVDSEPGTLPVVLRAIYSDGRSVDVNASLVVLGDEEESGFAWWKATLAAAVAVGLGGALLVVARRRA